MDGCLFLKYCRVKHLPFSLLWLEYKIEERKIFIKPEENKMVQNATFGLEVKPSVKNLVSLVVGPIDRTQGLPRSDKKCETLRK